VTGVLTTWGMTTPLSSAPPQHRTGPATDSYCEAVR
jgi:hypothetical protein